MDIVASGITTAGTVWGGLWTFLTASGHEALMIALVVSLVGAGIAIFYKVKSKAIGKRRR